MLITCQGKNSGYDDLVKIDFRQKPEVLPSRDGGLAHVVASNQYKTVNARFSKCPEYEKEQGTPRAWILPYRSICSNQSGIDHVVMCHNQQHRDASEQFQIRIAMLRR